MVHDDEKGGFYAFLLFLIWPFLAAASAVYNYRRRWAKNIVWAFVAFYGLTFAIGVESESSDIVRYVAQYQELHSRDMDFDTAKMYYEESGEIDIMRTAIAVTVSRFSDSQPILTLVYAIIFGFFFSRNMWYVMERLEGKVRPITILLVACFFLAIPIWQINGFRMWTAAHIFLYGALPFLFEGKKKGIWIAGLAMLFHFAYVLPFTILIGVAFIGKWLTLSFSAFLATVFISEIDLVIVNNLIESYAPEAFRERTSSYRVDQTGVEATAADQAASRRWYAVWYMRAISYSVKIFLVTMFITGRKYFEENPQWMGLFCFVLLFYAAANMLGSISSSGRFITLANFFSLPLIALYVQNVTQEKIMKRVSMLLTPALLLFLLVSVRIGIYSLSATTILGNPVVAYYTYENFMSLNDFLRSLL